MRDFNAKLFLYSALYLPKAWVAKLHHLLGFRIDEMVVLPILVRLLVLSAVVPKLVLNNQPAVEEQVDGVVQSGTTDAILVVLHPVIQRFDVEVAINGVNLLENGKPLRGLAEFVTMQIVSE